MSNGSNWGGAIIAPWETSKKILLLLALKLAPLHAQTEEVVVIGQSAEMVSELRQNSPSGAKIVYVTGRGAGDANLLREVPDAHAVI